MKSKLILISVVCAMMLAGCGSTESGTSESKTETTAATTTAAETAAEETTTAAETEAAEESKADESAETESKSEKKRAPEEEVGYEGMEEVTADKLKDGEYEIKVDSSSSMFKIDKCLLTVADGQMTAKMTMGGTGYECLFMGTEEAAPDSAESDRIAYEENDGVHSFTVPVEALDKVIDCAALSKKKQEWYGRKLVFRADSLSADAFADGYITTAESLGLADGEYTAEVTLEGGSGKASVQSPAKLTISGGKVTAEIIWSSNKYDYMVVAGEKIEPVSVEEFSVFEIPVTGFDYKMPVKADTTAMSTPHEIAYTLTFSAASVKAAE